ncbi:hypothetical protein ACFPM0_24780 [Pseudonocardia sulfidoxydans]|uniref:hypothetical protein n=1 Tax=Pseudonocardia sulfidoxydans TaxID=54011 RepID=UPI00361CD086
MPPRVHRPGPLVAAAGTAPGPARVRAGDPALDDAGPPILARRCGEWQRRNHKIAGRIVGNAQGPATAVGPPRDVGRVGGRVRPRGRAGRSRRRPSPCPRHR